MPGGRDGLRFPTGCAVKADQRLFHLAHGPAHGALVGRQCLVVAGACHVGVSRTPARIENRQIKRRPERPDAPGSIESVDCLALTTDESEQAQARIACGFGNANVGTRRRKGPFGGRQIGANTEHAQRQFLHCKRGRLRQLRVTAGQLPAQCRFRLTGERHQCLDADFTFRPLRQQAGFAIRGARFGQRNIGWRRKSGRGLLFSQSCRRAT